ncbi:MFS general substrate transporter [Basidiobolus meristosporus CBS 931.73]|uniref:MFS general substrate transporter n=1 Tax=Basidiobolus meristosporus CBS 931.73 TaxID=1314790 RepID=A0A1Y1Y8D0_9FUNG|nr:MFS general substrate transporter [Basidiobolus meristosporus CBS 931.73]|eukprot:ORX94271.1 MFS general substrate transporter [Basidiobolus meristosporus CBS 931.73]
MAETTAPTISVKGNASETNVEPPATPWYQRLSHTRGLLLFLICLAPMLDIINVASVTIALPSILRDVHYESNQLQWVVSSYALTYSAFLLVGGRMGDLFGHRRIFLIGTGWFSAWSLVCGFARNPIFMSVARGLQGAGAGLTLPSSLALLTTSYPPGPERTLALSIFGGASCIGQTVGVLLGGIFDATIGWYWTFFATAIISTVLCIAGIVVIPKVSNSPSVVDRRVDYLGVGLFTLGIIAIIYYLSESITAGWGSVKVLIPFLVGLAFLIGFVFWERRIEYPVMPFRIWRSRRFFSSVVVMFCVSAAYNITIFYTSLTFQNVLLYSPLITACCYIVHGVGLVIGLYTLTRLFLFMRSKLITLIGWCFIITSSIVFALIVPGSTYWQYAFPALIVNCIGLALTWMCCQVNAVADANDEDQGVVGAVFNVSVQVGGPVGLSVGTIISHVYEGVGSTPEALMSGYRAALYTIGVFGGVGFLLTVVLASNNDPNEFSGLPPKIDEDVEKNEPVTNSSNLSVLGGEQAEVGEEKFIKAQEIEARTH